VYRLPLLSSLFSDYRHLCLAVIHNKMSPGLTHTHKHTARKIPLCCGQPLHVPIQPTLDPSNPIMLQWRCMMLVGCYLSCRSTRRTRRLDPAAPRGWLIVHALTFFLARVRQE
jgi:hypothetical protein